jgi:hypothetical protein
MDSVGKVLGAFWHGRDTGREPASWAGELRSAAGSQRDQTMPTSVETSAKGGASFLRLQ